MTAMLRLPCLSDALPQDALVSAQATAEIEKIVDVSITDKPRSLAKGEPKQKQKIDQGQLQINQILTKL